MVNNINAFELSDEQLDTITGGSLNFASIQNAGNGLTQLNLAVAPTANISGINFGKLEQSGATVWQGNASKQEASNS